jgi:hypothetical protein
MMRNPQDCRVMISAAIIFLIDSIMIIYISEMILQRIISGGQTGVERAAQDFAIKHDISHGGCCMAEDGSVPARYKLQEMHTDNYSKVTEQNVIDSDGTLIISRGQLAGGTDRTRRMALKHKKQPLGIDLNLSKHRDTSSLIASWIQIYRIKILNIAGPNGNEDALIYVDVIIILEGTLKILMAGDTESSKYTPKPETVHEAIDRLESEMGLKDKIELANLPEENLTDLHFSLGLYARNRFLYPRNDKLLESCRSLSGDKFIHWDQAGSFISKEFWKRLQATHKLRVVKNDP